MTDNKQSKLYLENFIQRYIDENNEYNQREEAKLIRMMYELTIQDIRETNQIYVKT